eukprot:12937560-Prorocentrum_lima.AAC.1
MGVASASRHACSLKAVMFIRWAFWVWAGQAHQVCTYVSGAPQAWQTASCSPCAFPLSGVQQAPVATAFSSP